MLLRRLATYARLSPRLAVMLLVLSIVDSLWAPVFPKVTAYIQNDVIPGRDYNKLWQAIAIVVFVGLLRDILSYFRTRVSGKFGQMITFNIRSALYNKLQRLPIPWFDKQRTGDIMTRVADDVPSMERVLNEGLETLVRLIFQVLVVAGTLFSIDVPLTFVAMIPIPLLIIGGIVSTKAAQRVYRVGREASSTLNSLVNDNISGIRQIKAYHLLDQEWKRFNEASDAMRKANLGINRFWAISSPIMGAIVALGYTSVLAYGAHRCFQNHIKAGDLSVYLLLLWAFYDPIQRLKDLHQLLQSAQTAADRVFAIMDLPDEIGIDEGVEISTLKGHVKFSETTFSYGERPTLSGVSLEAQPGETIALAGSSGAGKSTILYLLTRFYEYNGGSVQLDGTELNQISKSSLRRNLGYVTQEAFLFNGSIRDNLKIAKADATDDEIWAALRSANAENFVTRQPEGLETIVGERGVRLSGGEKQRISIARVLLKNPAILLLDEATASVDNETERLIQEALDRLMKGRTAFVIAHRLSTIRNADRIYVMDQGHIVESGKHEQLANAGGLYAKLCQTSFREDVEAKPPADEFEHHALQPDPRLPFQQIYSTPPGEIPPRPGAG